MPGRVAIFLSHADPVSLRLAGSCALTAAAMGERVDVFVFGPAVAALARARDGGEEDEAAASLLEARAAGEVRLLACSASAAEVRLRPEEAERGFDAVVGWPTVAEWTRGVVDRFFF